MTSAVSNASEEKEKLDGSGTLDPVGRGENKGGKGQDAGSASRLRQPDTTPAGEDLTKGHVKKLRVENVSQEVAGHECLQRGALLAREHERREFQHLETRESLCEYCGKELLTRRQLEAHMDGVHKGAHLAPARSSCEHCKQNYTTETALGLHVQEAHGVIGTREAKRGEHRGIRQGGGKLQSLRDKQSNPTICEECGKDFARADSLRRHGETVHGKERGARSGPTNFPCNLCQTHYPSGVSLAAHVRMEHAAAIEYSCAGCQFSDRGKAVVEQHLVDSHATLGGQCGQCGTELSWDQVGDHMFREHRGSPHPQCLECALTFSSRAELKSHVAMHGRDGPVCDLCNLVLDGHRELAGHMDTHHTGFKFRCPCCSGKHAEQNLVDKHILREHVMPSEATTQPKDATEGPALGANAVDSLGCKSCGYVARSGLPNQAKRNLKRHVERLHPDAATRASSQRVVFEALAGKRTRRGDPGFEGDSDSKATRLPKPLNQVAVQPPEASHIPAAGAPAAL